MDASSSQWITDMGLMKHVTLECNGSLPSESFSSCTTDDLFGKNLSFERPAKMAKTSSLDSSNNSELNVFWNHSNQSTSSTAHFLSFAGPNATPPQDIECKGPRLKQKVKTDYNAMTTNSCFSDQSNEMNVSEEYRNKRDRSMASTPSNLLSQDHVMAERRRRQKLNQKLIALSALVPGLRKVDKASILGDAVRYLKQLQEQVQTLEERAKRNVQSVVQVKKSYLSLDDDEDANSSSSSATTRELNPNSGSEENALPEIEARVMDKEVLICIHCEKQNGLLPRILNEMEKLDFSIANSNSMPFGDYDQAITITVQMKGNCDISTKDLVSKLRAAAF